MAAGSIFTAARHLALPSFDIMQHLPFGQQPLSLPQQPEGAIVVWVALWAIKPNAMTKMLSITNSFDFIISSEFGLRADSPVRCNARATAQMRHRKEGAGGPGSKS